MKKTLFILSILCILSGSGEAQNAVTVLATTNGALLTPTNLFGANSNAIYNAIAGAIGGGSQTPLLQNINAAGYKLTNAGVVQATNFNGGMFTGAFAGDATDLINVPAPQLIGDVPLTALGTLGSPQPGYFFMGAGAYGGWSPMTNLTATTPLSITAGVLSLGCQPAEFSTSSGLLTLATNQTFGNLTATGTLNANNFNVTNNFSLVGYGTYPAAFSSGQLVNAGATAPIAFSGVQIQLAYNAGQFAVPGAVLQLVTNQTLASLTTTTGTTNLANEYTAGTAYAQNSIVTNNLNVANNLTVGGASSLAGLVTAANGVTAAGGVFTGRGDGTVTNVAGWGGVFGKTYAPVATNLSGTTSLWTNSAAIPANVISSSSPTLTMTFDGYANSTANVTVYIGAESFTSGSKNWSAVYTLWLKLTRIASGNTLCQYNWLFNNGNQTTGQLTLTDGWSTNVPVSYVPSISGGTLYGLNTVIEASSQ